MRIFSYLVISAAILFGFTASLVSQELASRDPQLRNVVLEEFTGIHCGYCPDGHKRANALKEANPGRVVLINIHAGSFSVPSAGEPDFRTAFGAQLDAFAMVAGYPAGSVNRIAFPGAANGAPYYPQKVGGTAMGRVGWAKAAPDSVLNGSISPVNIGAKPNWAGSTRELSVDVELYFTSAVAGAVKLNVVLIESHVWGPQSSAPDPKNYEHNYILRHMITGQWGEQITATTQGSATTKNFKYTVPANIKIENCDLAIFVTSSTNQYIYTGIALAAITPDVSITTTGDVVDAKKANETFTKTFNLKNTSAKEMEFAYSIAKSSRTPSDWEAKLISTSNTVKLAAGESKEVEAGLTLGSTLGIGDAILTVAEAGNPDAISFTSKITAVSNAKYFEINLGGTMESVIKAGGRNEILSLSAADFTPIANKVTPSVTIWNSGPKGGLTAAISNAIVDLMNKGVGVWINGSVPLPMLSFESPTHPLFTKLGVTWKSGDDIELTAFSIEGIAGDPVADGLKASGTNTTNGFYLQPMTITNAGTTVPMTKNTEQDKTVSVRVTTPTSKAIYLSFNLDLITNAADKTNLIKKAIDWLENTTDVEDESTSSISIYPNPATEFVTVTGISGIATISDLFGRIIWTGEVVDGMQIPVSAISTGIYLLNVNNKVFKFVKE